MLAAHAIGNGAGHRRDVHPVGFALSRINTVGSCIGDRVVSDEPAIRVAPEHEAVALGVIFLAGIAEHLFQNGRVGCQRLLHGGGVDQYAVLNAGNIGGSRFCIIYIDNQVLKVVKQLGTFLQFLDVLIGKRREIVVSSHIDKYGALCILRHIWGVVVIFATGPDQERGR